MDTDLLLILKLKILGGNIMTEFVALGAKTYSYLRDDDREVRKDKGTKK